VIALALIWLALAAAAYQMVRRFEATGERRDLWTAFGLTMILFVSMLANLLLK
jgi:hypothetical protein